MGARRTMLGTGIGCSREMVKYDDGDCFQPVQRRASDMSEHKNPFSRSECGPVVAELLVPPRLAPLGPGSPNRAVEARLRSLTPADLFAPRRIVDADMAAACLAGLWLYHDFLDESHTISQSLETTSGSYWHGLMHRREPDFANPECPSRTGPDRAGRRERVSRCG